MTTTKPPTDPIASAARAIKIATGEIDEEPERRFIVKLDPEPREKVRDKDG